MTGDPIAKTLLFAAAALLLPGVALAETTMQIDPASLAVGETGRLTITTDASEQPPAPPRVDGLSIQHRGSSMRTSVSNGVIETSSQFVYSVTPQRAGTFTIPAMDVGRERTAPASLVAGGQAKPATPRAKAEQQRSSDRRAFVRITGAPKEAVVGQAIEATIRAYFRADTGAAVTGDPKIASRAFTVTQSGEATRSETEIDGVPHNVLTWRVVLVPAFAGTHDLKVEVPAMLEYREMEAAPSRDLLDLLGDDPFGGGDPFGDSFFGGSPFDSSARQMLEDLLGGALGPVQQTEVTLRHSAGKLVATPPPTEDRPADFAGAVGSFEISAALASTQLTAGEPTTLTIRVTGEGNFDSLQSVGLPASADWKTYPAKATFEPAGRSPVRGTKVFEQLVVPTSDGVTSLPSISLSSYDAQAGRYVASRTEPIDVQVAAAAGAPSAPSVAATNAGTDPLQPGHVVSFVPLYQRPVFLAFPLTALAIVLVPLVTRLVRRHRGQRSFRETRRALDRAAATGDARALFIAARAALRVRLAALWQVNPDSITAADVRARAQGPDAAQTIALFDLAERADYGDDALPQDTRRWHQAAQKQLRALEERR